MHSCEKQIPEPFGSRNRVVIATRPLWSKAAGAVAAARGFAEADSPIVAANRGTPHQNFTFPS